MPLGPWGWGARLPPSGEDKARLKKHVGRCMVCREHLKKHPEMFLFLSYCIIIPTVGTKPLFL